MVSRFAAWIGALGVVASMSVAPAGTAAGAGRLAEESTTALTASPGSIIYGEDIEFTATVTGAVGTPTGAVSSASTTRRSAIRSRWTTWEWRHSARRSCWIAAR